MNGQGSYIDPVTGQERIVISPSPQDGSGPHMHVNDPSGLRLDMNGNCNWEDARGSAHSVEDHVARGATSGHLSQTARRIS